MNPYRSSIAAHHGSVTGVLCGFRGAREIPWKPQAAAEIRHDQGDALSRRRRSRRIISQAINTITPTPQTVTGVARLMLDSHQKR